MKQVFSSLKAMVLILVFSLFTIACSGDFFPKDVPFNVDTKTTDITLANSEIISLNVLQSTIIAHQNTALYNFLDASDFPAGASNGVSQNCLASGTKLFTISRDALDLNGKPSVYQVGDTLSASYDQCDDGNGTIYNGTVNATYTKIKGLNPTFVKADTFNCVANLSNELSLGEVRGLLNAPSNLTTVNTTLDANLDNNLQPISYSAYRLVDNSGVPLNIYFVVGDDLRFFPHSDKIDVQVLKRSSVPSLGTSGGGVISTIDTMLGFFTVQKNESIIIVNMRSKIKGNQSKASSLGGDQIFSLVSTAESEEYCQRYERTLSAQVTNLSTQKSGITTTLNGAITLFESSQNLIRHDKSIVNSNFFTKVKQGNLESNFEMLNATLAKSNDIVSGAYSTQALGDIISSSLFGRMSLATSKPFEGQIGITYPTLGVLTASGVGLERIVINSLDEKMRLDIDYNGDASGNGFSDIDDRIFTTWADLFDHKFLKAIF